MANSDDFDIQSPDDILQQQQNAYDQAQYRATPMQRASNGGLYGVQNLFGGGPAVTQARQVQAQLQSIMATVNANSDPDEDPLTKQLRTAQAISTGMMGVSPQIALKAQDQAVKIAQAQSQQKLLSVETQEAQTKLGITQRQAAVAANTPQSLMLVEDQGKDDQGLPLGFKTVKSYDLTDPAQGAAIRADMAAAQANGQSLIPMTPDMVANSRVQVAASNAAARYQAAQLAAQQRMQQALVKAQQTGVQSSINDRYTDRVMSGADMAIGGLESIANLPMGTSRGWFTDGQMARPGESMLTMTGQNLRNAMTNTDSQLYNTFTAGLGNNLAAVETQGLGQGLQQLAARLQDKIQNKPGDSPITIMGKLAEARDTIDRGIAIKMADSKLDPSKRDEMQQMLERLHQSIPFTRNDVVAFNNASQANPSLSFTQWAAKQRVPGAASDGRQAPAYTAPTPMGTDRNGKPARVVFGDDGNPLPNNGVQ